MVFLVGVIVGAILLKWRTLRNLGDAAQAQGSAAWHVAGGPEGFSIADWGTGQGADVSLDQWIESIPVECDIQTISRGVTFFVSGEVYRDMSPVDI